jgi:hypothetical protein
MDVGIDIGPSNNDQSAAPSRERRFPFSDRAARGGEAVNKDSNDHPEAPLTVRDRNRSGH